jgi:hypothetical protein
MVASLKPESVCTNALAKNTPHEVRVVLYTGGSGFGNPVLYVFNRKQGGSE